MTGRIGRKRTVDHNGITYKVRSDKIEIPDLATMDGTAAAMWLIRNTYPRGFSRATNPLQGCGGAINVTTRQQ
jgi:hypothetical protein